MVSNRFAYSAKAAAATTENQPDDWPDGWSFPGPPWPPSYPEPGIGSYSVALLVDGSAVGVYDSGDQPTIKATITTSDPSYWYQGQNIVFSAVFTSDASTVPIRLVGDTSYGNTVTGEITNSGFLGYSNSFEFDDTGYVGVPFIVTAQVQVLTTTGYASGSIYMDAARFFALSPSTTNITRGVDFSVEVQSILAGQQDTTYSPSADLSITAVLSDGSDALTPTSIDTTGWASGAKTVTNFNIDGGSGVDTATITITDSVTGRVGVLEIGIAQGTPSPETYLGDLSIDDYIHGLFPPRGSDTNPSLPQWTGVLPYDAVEGYHETERAVFKYVGDYVLAYSFLYYSGIDGYWIFRVVAGSATVGGLTVVSYKKEWGDTAEGTFIRYQNFSGQFAPPSIVISKSS
jgi:hypothetical protein